MVAPLLPTLDDDTQPPLPRRTRHRRRNGLRTTAAATILAIVSSSSVLNVQADPNASCYFPGGNRAFDFYPCIAYGAPVTHCCPQGWTCFSNTLCIVTTESNAFPNLTMGAAMRGACTSPLWNNEDCGSACLTTDMYNEGRLAPCTNESFCCDSDYATGTCDCSEDGGSFEISVGVVQTIIEVTDTTFTGVPSLSLVSPLSSTSATTTPASDSSSRTTRATSTATETSSSSPSPSGTDSGAGSGPQGPGGSDASTQGGEGAGGGSNSGEGINPVAVGVGVGLGVPIALAIIGAVIYLVFYRNRNGGAASGTTEQSEAMDQLAERDINGPQALETGYGWRQA